MVKLDPSLLRFLEDEDFRVLTALEMASRNHEVAPTVLIERIAQLPHGGCKKRLRALLKHKVIHHENTAYDGYGMKYAAFDFLALRTLAKRGSVAGVGCRIGCGKESDIFLIEDEQHQEAVLKLQRLGRCSFRSVARNRDYKDGKQRRGASWFYLSRLAATKEFAFMKMLYDEGFPVPRPIDHNRHAVVMEKVKGTLLNHIVDMEKEDAQRVYERCVKLVVKLAQHGLIHGDFNEFNCFVTEDLRVVLIDFPQMVSTDHKNAVDLFNRDIENLAAFFQRRFKVNETLHPTLEKDVDRIAHLDRQVMASGFSRGDQDTFDELLAENETEGDCEDPEDQLGEVVEPISLAQLAATEFSDEQLGDPEHSAEVAGDDDDEGHGGEEDEESTSDESSDARQVRRTSAPALNPNISAGGQLNLDHIKKRVKANANYQEMQSFNRGMHRNMQKGRDKQSLRRQMKGVRDVSSAADW